MTILTFDFTRYAWAYFLEHKATAADAFRKVLANVRADDVSSEVEIVRADNGGEFLVWIPGTCAGGFV